MTLEVALRVVGALQLALAGLHLTFPRHLGWREELPRLSLLNRQIFVVHTIFVCFVLVLFGALSLCAPRTLLEPSALSRFVLVGITAFWALRLAIQLWYFDASLWRGHRDRTIAHVGFTALWVSFFGTYGLVLARQW